jgi:hypothetical protein
MFIQLFAGVTWIATWCAGILWFFAFFDRESSAVQQAAGAALAVALVAIPYVFTRSAEIVSKKDDKIDEKILAQLTEIKSLLENQK